MRYAVQMHYTASSWILLPLLAETYETTFRTILVLLVLAPPMVSGATRLKDLVFL